jgi:hypothetical protein
VLQSRVDYRPHPQTLHEAEKACQRQTPELITDAELRIRAGLVTHCIFSCRYAECRYTERHYATCYGAANEVSFIEVGEVSG